MALAYGNLDALSHQLRFLLFEIGIGLSQNNIDYLITLAHKNTLLRLEQAVLAEKLVRSPIRSHHVHDFMDQLRVQLKQLEPESLFYQWDNLQEELDESIANETLALAYKLRWNSQIRDEARSHDSLWSWIKNECTAHEALSFLEQWGCQGHPYHPCFRAKTGFTRREVLQNSAEFQARIRLHWCALRKNKITTSTNRLDFKTSMALNFPDEFKRWQEQLALNHADPQEYIPIPIHPWQWRNRLQALYNHFIDDKSLILLPHHQIVMPAMSEQVMMPEHQSSAYIKLSLGINTPWNTRTPEEHYDDRLLHWVYSLLEQTNYYQNTLYLTKKSARLTIYNPSTYPHDQPQLSVNLLQNPAILAGSDQKIVPLSSLLSISPITSKPLLIEIIQSSGLTPMFYFQHYCRIILSSQLNLLVKHGIAFNTHHQNALIMFTDDMPQGLLIRDHENIKVACANSLENTKELDCSSNETLEVHHYFIQGTLQNNIDPWIKTLKQEYQLDTPSLWNIVDQVMQDIFTELSKEIPLAFLNQQKRLLLSHVWQNQCVLRMKLTGNMATSR